MKQFFNSSMLSAVAAVSILAGCAGTSPMQNGSGNSTMDMRSMHQDGKPDCACCNMDKHEMSSSMTQPGMMHDKMASGQGGMCMPGQGGKTQGACPCCGMNMGKEGGCACCGQGMKGMTPEMHKQHMEMMQQQSQPSTQSPVK